MRALLLVLVSAVAGFVPQQGPPRDRPAQREASSPATGAISGRVYAADTGSPIRGAIVSLAVDVSLDSSAPAVTQLPFSMGRAERGPVASTDALGRFRITAVPAGTYRLLVIPAGYLGRYLPMGYGAGRANDAGRPIVIRAGEEMRGVDVGLPIAVAIEGRVVDENGEPLSRVPVFAARLSAGSESPQRASQLPVVSDDLGRYRIYGLEPGTYIVNMPEATVYVFAEDRASWDITSPRTVSNDVDANGRFRVSGLAAGRYLAVAVAREGFRKPPNPGVAFFELLSKEATPFVVGDDERRTLDLPLWRWPE